MDLDDVVVVDAVRSPTGKSGWKPRKKKGALYYSTAHELTKQVIEDLVRRVMDKSSAFDPNEIDDLAWGCSGQMGEQAGNLGRIGVIISDKKLLPDSVAGWTIDRYCNAGLQAINSQAHSIACGCGDIKIAGGCEFLSKYPMGCSIQATFKDGRKHKLHKNFMKRSISMGMAAEKIAAKWDLDRADLDEFSAWSHRKAVEAMRDEDWYKKRICPIKVQKYDRETDKKIRGEYDIIKKDEPPRSVYLDKPEKAMSFMKKLKPRFKTDGRIHAGNSSAIVDGAAAVMLMSQKKADELGLKPMARFVTTAVAGDDPLYMLEGPIPAQHKCFKRSGLRMEDMDIIEPNEAFSSPVLAFAKEFEYDFMDPRVNPTGGGISIGHPIGCSGALYFTEMVWEMIHQNHKLGIQTLCGGGGVGIATIMKRD
ncbi:MAG: acetyl-CoA C-acyltransferase [Candidatus Lokiarchaeota archaeon]|nr:acetyl-CoA C-acyltransferase [Candidatus Lokiarchaeota archaeon]